MKSTILKTTLREIRESLGRYMAILAIVALGVGFFTGLKVTKPAMLKAGGEYLEKNNPVSYTHLRFLRFLLSTSCQNRCPQHKYQSY